MFQLSRTVSDWVLKPLATSLLLQLLLLKTMMGLVLLLYYLFYVTVLLALKVVNAVWILLGNIYKSGHCSSSY